MVAEGSNDAEFIRHSCRARFYTVPTENLRWGIKPRPTITGICQALICCKGGAWDEHLDYRADIQRG